MLVNHKTQKTGVLVVGLAGNNGSTFLATKILHQKKEMTQMLGSLAALGTLPVSQTIGQKPLYKSFRDLVPSLLVPENIIVDGWDIRSMTMEEAMVNAAVVPLSVIQSIKDEANKTVPKKSIYYSSFLADNQQTTATNIHTGDVARVQHLRLIQNDIQQFKKQHSLEQVFVLWSGSTERCMIYDDNVIFETETAIS